MRRKWFFAPLASVVLLASFASLFDVQWLSPGRVVFVQFSRGALTLRVFKPHDFALSRPGLYVGGFTGAGLVWSPRAALRDRLWISPMPPSAAGSVVVSKPYTIPCAVLLIPMYLPLLAFVLGGGGWWWARRRRRVTGHCRDCGYDRRGLPAPGPECGHDGPTWRTILARAARCILLPACASSTSQPA